jgi:hypothetical protein
MFIIQTKIKIYLFYKGILFYFKYFVIFAWFLEQKNQARVGTWCLESYGVGSQPELH